MHQGLFQTRVCDMQREEARRHRAFLRTLLDERCHGMRGIREPPPRNPPNAAQGETFAQAALKSQGIHLPQDVGDEEFETAKTAHIDVIPLTDKLMLQGLTFPLMDHLKDLGFTYERDIEEANGVNAYTIAQADFDAASMTGLLNQWGWTYELYDAAA